MPATTGKDILNIIHDHLNLNDYRKVHWEGSFEEYLDIVRDNPAVTRTAYQRLYDMILSHGIDERQENNKERTVRYKFFTEFGEKQDDAVYGLDRILVQLVNAFKSAAHEYGTERRVLLMHGPVGSSKSTIARLLKRGLEEYSRTDEGMLFSFSWKGPDDTWLKDPMHSEPLQLIPPEMRPAVIARLTEGREQKDYRYSVQIKGELSPYSRYMFNDRLAKYKGDITAMLANEIKVYRLTLSEQDRIGIGTFQPKDEKNQDSTELTGDINYRKIAEYGSDSDPRAFNFDGELNIANRGLVEFIEVLKLDVAFLYDLLGASQEHKIKPKKFAQTDIDEVIIAHTNEPEYRRLQNNEFMEALRDRTVKIDVPYVTRLTDEIRIYVKSFNNDKVRGKHIAPHTIEVAAMWAVLTRLEQPKHANLTLLQKMKLYNGKSLPGFTEDNIIELKREAPNEGMHGISPRYIQDKISNALVAHPEEDNINPFLVMHELEAGLRHHSLISGQDQLQHFKELLQVVRQEYEDIVKNEVQRAIAADEDALQRLCGNYIDNVKSYTQREKVRNRFTGGYDDPDERLMRSIEDKIDIPESRKDDFRREIMNYIGALAIDGKRFDYKTNERLMKALELKLFEDQKDSIKLTSLVSNVVDKATQEKIDVVKSRLIKYYGYNESSATDVLNFVASIFARGQTKK